MQHIYRFGEAYRVDSAKRVSIEVAHDLQHAGAAEPLERLGIGRFAAYLGVPQRTAHMARTLLGKPLRSSLVLLIQRTGLGWSLSSGSATSNNLHLCLIRHIFNGLADFPGAGTSLRSHSCPRHRVVLKKKIRDKVVLLRGQAKRRRRHFICLPRLSAF
jgi:hypothetical protein